jgi:meso-butanediol dehydrogenase / (S,S)-butanediol dehydrogenase / diacetyl reductase
VAGRIEGKVALITGAASGLGLATAERFAKEGGVVVGADVTADAKSEASGVRELDVRDEGAVSALVDAIVAEHGRLDVVVNYAGVAGGGPVHMVDAADWDRVLDVNLKGTFLVNKHALRPMLQQKSGSIVNIASVEGLQGTEGGSSYNASKGAVVVLTKNMAIDYGRVGIRVNAICPGFIDTPMFRAVMGSEHMTKFRDEYRDDHMLGRFGRPEEIAAAALFLASDDASFVTGVALPVDGGYLAGTRTGLSDLMGIA